MTVIFAILLCNLSGCQVQRPTPQGYYTTAAQCMADLRDKYATDYNGHPVPGMKFKDGRYYVNQYEWFECASMPVAEWTPVQ